MNTRFTAILAITLFSSLSLQAAPASGVAAFALLPVPVPDTGSSVVLLGMSFVALVALRKKSKR